MTKKPLKPWKERPTESFFSPAWTAFCEGDVNLAVVLGPRSGHLCALDFDLQEDLDTWDFHNPELSATTRTVGARGAQSWFRLVGPYPPSEKTKQCEWRAEGNLSTFAGIHPSGSPYRLINAVEPMEIRFEDICWPDGWPVPGIERAHRELVEDLVKRYGDPIFRGPKGEPVAINETFWAALYDLENQTIFAPEENQFFRYCEASGLWLHDPEQVIRRRIGEMLFRHSKGMNVPFLSKQRTQARLCSLESQVGNLTARSGAFKRDKRKEPILHVANGVLIWRGDKWVFEPFSPDFYSRNASPVAYQPGAACPRFLNELVGPCLAPEDVETLRLLLGQFLVGYNLTQSILILDGEAGTGKSQIVEVIRGLVGGHNCVNLRTELLHERFELANYRDKTLLLGSDVSNDFLSNRGAPVLKALVGGDRLLAEIKGVAQSQPLEGHFNVLVTSNSRLRMRLQDDVSAWRRRLVILTSEGAPPKRAIPDFGARLLRDEGPGILEWAIGGLALLFRALDEGNGRLPLTDGQRQRIERALAESDSLKIFLTERVRWDSAADLTTDEIVQGYAVWSHERELSPMPDGLVQRVLPDLMMELFRTARATDIDRDGRNRRGYRHVDFVLQTQK